MYGVMSTVWRSYQAKKQRSLWFADLSHEQQRVRRRKKGFMGRATRQQVVGLSQTKVGFQQSGEVRIGETRLDRQARWVLGSVCTSLE